MQRIKTRSFLAIGALGLALLPFSGAEAKPKDKDKGGPPDFAPAYGRRNRDGNFDRDVIRNRDDVFRPRDNDTIRRNGYGRIVTLEGVVTSADSSRNSGISNFRVQAGGRVFDVASNSPVRVRTGQRVILRGSFDNNNRFDARTVTLAGRGNGNGSYGNGGYGNGGYDDGNYGDYDYGNGTGGNDQRVNFPGVVTRVFNSGELEVRAENGRTYRVLPRSSSDEYQVGNRIRVAGTASGNRVENARITLQNGGVVGPRRGGIGGIFGNGGIFGGGNGGYSNGGNYGDDNDDEVYGNNGGSYRNSGQRVTFSGRLVSVDNSRRTAQVRGDNGRTYTVRGDELKSYKGGELVRVYGTSRNGVIELSEIDRTDR